MLMETKKKIGFRLEFESFLRRCPELNSLDSLCEFRNAEVLCTDDYVVSTVAQLVLHPSYTIPLLGCFRSIAKKILDKSVSLLRLVPNLRSNSGETAAVFEGGEVENVIITGDNILHIIDFYVGRGRGLYLHQLACLSFCRAVDLLPFLWISVVHYFEFAPSPFQCFVKLSSHCELPKRAYGDFLNVIRVSYRFLLMDPEYFSKHWDWSCFLDFLRGWEGAVIDSQDSENHILDIKWCALQVLSIIFKVNVQVLKVFDIGEEEAFRCWLHWQKFCQDVSIEKASWLVEAPLGENKNNINERFNEDHRDYIHTDELSSSILSPTVNESSPRNRRLLECNPTKNNDPFILTSNVKRCYEMVQLAVDQKQPVLLYGPHGSGKTALISELARRTGSRVFYIHIDDQIDGKMLVGGYICGEKPGEFRWKPGSLTLAVLSGFWIVFENIDSASPDIISALSPLLEGSNSFLTSQGERIKVAEGFRMFSTVTGLRFGPSRGGASLVHWEKFMVTPPVQQDLHVIIKAWYPHLEPLIEKLVQTFERILYVSLHQQGGFETGRFSIRDLLKWCKRLAGLSWGHALPNLSSALCCFVYQEAVDVFAASFASPDHQLYVMKEIAKIWGGVEVSSIEQFFPQHKPSIQESLSNLAIGRVTLQRSQTAQRDREKPFVELPSSVIVLERIAASVKYNEPILLVGETGTGKTTIVQNLASRLGQKLTVLNLSQQSDISDLLGGYKPVDARLMCVPLYNEFEKLFSITFSVKGNVDFLRCLQKHLCDKKWKSLLNGFHKFVKYFWKSFTVGKDNTVRKRKKHMAEEIVKSWEIFSMKVESLRNQMGFTSGTVFSFVEGSFISALKRGEWILLDEVNLAPPETLQRIASVLEGEKGSLCLVERGDVDYVRRHPDFRLFACMNPATDAGKRDLPYYLRNRFTEYFVHDILNDEDLTLFINQFVNVGISNQDLVCKIVRFYKAARVASDTRLQDGANQRPQYSLRSLFRAIEYMTKARKKFGFPKALYDGFYIFFNTMLDKSSGEIMNHMIASHLFGGTLPPHHSFDAYITTVSNSFGHFVESYVLTRSVKENLGKLACASFIKKYPVLLQGPTSSGKTSLVQFLAAISGYQFVRINNHEHTDIQDYLGSYVVCPSGKLVFREGALVRAVRNGYWIVLDELNLAPSDVLEALNRLLDDNRELFVPELCEIVRAHENFMLFATQNPPNFYAGRKILSRAFRNRFVEIHVDELPEDEMVTILERRCEIPKSYAEKMVGVMRELQLRRQHSRAFAGKHGFITPRDLFRWANRFRSFGNCYLDLARDGYFLLAERLRDDSEKSAVQEVLEKHFRVTLVRDDLYKQELSANDTVHSSGVTWTRSMQRLYYLLERCYKMREPVLLVGETGGGKTTVCQLLSVALKLELCILNCHHHTETSDFIGAFYPLRERSKLASDFQQLAEKMKLSKVIAHFPGNDVISPDITEASQTLGNVSAMLSSCRHCVATCSDITDDDFRMFEQMYLELAYLSHKWQTFFMWQDGPLVKAMKDGTLFLIDEISLADDSVLERLNSVLEPEREVFLAEKGGSELEKVVSHPKFFLLATMNPGGDFGKKELSPALRNRFTEIWVPSICDMDELRSIAFQRLVDIESSKILYPLLNFWMWFNCLNLGRVLTVRDLLSWIDFVKACGTSLPSELAFMHGAFLILLDGLSLGTGLSKEESTVLRNRCFSFLLKQLENVADHMLFSSKLSRLESYGWGDIEMIVDISSCNCDQQSDMFGIEPFYIKNGNDGFDTEGFEFLAPTTRRNALRVLRALQLPKPVLLEGSPGVGKTSLVVALGKFSGHKVLRINLSEQTDMMDLLGSDLPVESEQGLKFSWSDGILLRAIKSGYWVLLDELNLAPQAVLEGLNAILDHRSEVFVPELNCTFKCAPSFRVFACQNPSNQGGGRKGLPRSFLNRFTKVYVDELIDEDYLCICSSLYPTIPKYILTKLIMFNKKMHEETTVLQNFGHDGSPWEFNLRDVIRSCSLIQGPSKKFSVSCFLNIVYMQRMRTVSDRWKVLALYEQVFGIKPFINPYPRVQVSPDYVIIGNTSLKRSGNMNQVPSVQLNILPEIRLNLEAVAQCVQHQWLCILVGSSGCGKTSLLRVLAQVTGNVLNELILSPSTDTSDLLGCFEQYSVFCHLQKVVAVVERYVNNFCVHLGSSKDQVLHEKKYILGKWIAFSSCMDRNHYTSNSSSLCEAQKNIFGSLHLLIEIIERLQLGFEQHIGCLPCSDDELSTVLNIVMKLQEDYLSRTFSAKFEWVEGPLINAIEKGEWIVLENSSLCNPTVLGRINSLVEPCGTITVNECGNVRGEPLVLHPHPNFRMFLTVNSEHGEVSRAMRNRGVEIFVMPPHWLLEKESKNSIEEAELKSVKRFLVLSGIPTSELENMMAKAHIYAKNESFRLNKNITYREIKRWVRLFHQLLACGNQTLWSLQTSYEHTYISSLGEEYGLGIVTQAKASYFTEQQFIKNRDLSGSLCLPGGRPIPLKLHDFVCSSRAASVYQNCTCLEFMGSQYASIEFLASQRFLGTLASRGSKCMQPHLVSTKCSFDIMFQNTLGRGVLNYTRPDVFDRMLNRQILYFVASWTFEQATEIDLRLYLLWFRWFSSRLLPYCLILESFVTLLDEELKHPIWNCIFQCRRELLSACQVNLDSHPVPILSLELLSLYARADIPASALQLANAIKCVGLLRSTIHQWHSEVKYDFDHQSGCFKSSLRSLHMLEEAILNMLMHSPDFSVLIQMYDELFQLHELVWERVSCGQFENLPVIWCLLRKNIKKWRPFLPKFVNIFLVDSKNLNELFSWSPSIQKSMLWVYGGHPLIPYSSDVYYNQHQLLTLCESIWPEKTKALEQEKRSSLEIAAALNYELRLFAVEALCKSFLISWQNEESDVHHIVQQLKDTYHILSEKFMHEKDKLKGNLETYEDCMGLDLTDYCRFAQKLICTELRYDDLLNMLAINDGTSFFLDMKLLELLTMSILVGLDIDSDSISELSRGLKHAYKFSLSYTSRSPTNFCPHQKLICVLDTSISQNYKSLRLVAGFVLEMWFKWHSTLWGHPSIAADSCGASLPDILFQPSKLVMAVHILRSTFSIKNCSLQSLRLRVASRDLWLCFEPEAGLFECLSTCARLLLSQIIHSHKKSFDTDKYHSIASIFSSFHSKTITEKDINYVVSLIASSRHKVLNSLMDLFIKPAIKELYACNCSWHDLGFAWLRIGALRLHLLICCTSFDPATKYAVKSSQLNKKISLLKLKDDVRRECEHLSGSVSSQDFYKEGKEYLKNLESECRRMQKKVVFRAHPEKFNRLKHECDELLKFAASVFGLLDHLLSMDSQQVAELIGTWLRTGDGFIERLSDEYDGYADIIMPIQVGMYEMKLGLSLVLSDIFLKDFLLRAEEDDMEKIFETVYSFMRFPRSTSKYLHVEVIPSPYFFSCYKIIFPESTWMADLNLLDKLVILKENVAFGNVNPRVDLLLCILVRVAHSITDARLLYKASFLVLDKLFSEFSSIWFSMKAKTKAVEDSETQLYKFRPRSFKVESILEADVSFCGESFENGAFLEWEKVLSEQEYDGKEEPRTGHTTEIEDFIGDLTLNKVVYIHNLLFGSRNLVESPGTISISDTDRLQSFVDSYDLGASVIKDLRGLFSSSIDSKLLPEHVLRLCLENDYISGASLNSVHVYNFYKDANTTMIEKMSKALRNMKPQVLFLLKEWEDHPSLKKILDIIETLLNLHPRTPLAKALSGLQFLLHAAWWVLENCPKLDLSRQLDPIVNLVSSWHKLELDSWPQIFNEIHRQYENNAWNLWFPLYSVIHQRSSADIAASNLVIIQSLEEFIQTSSAGEFRKRLELLFAFQVHIQTGVELGSYSSVSLDTLKILYNTSGFYMHFLPIVEAHIEDKRRSAETEVKELLKLCSWNCSDYYSIKNARRNVQKLKKIIQKYNDALQQPLFMILHQKTASEGVRTRDKPHMKSLYDFSVKTDELLGAAFELTQAGIRHSSIHVSSWSEKRELALESLKLTSKISFKHNDYEEVICDIVQGITSMSANIVCGQEQDAIWIVLGKICGSIMGCRDIWKVENKSLRKGRALSELLKQLEHHGLSRHTLMLEKSTWLFLQPSYDVRHLLIHQSEISSRGSAQFENLSHECVDLDWKVANQNYFKSLAAVQFLQEVSLNFHKDFTLEQVNQSISFANHLVVIQQEQRDATYTFAEHLRKLKECMNSLAPCFSTTSSDQRTTTEVHLIPHQHIAVRCMWQQKQLFDALYTTLYEERLLLGSFVQNQSDSADVKAAARGLLLFIDSFIERFRKSKDLLNNFLVGVDGAKGVVALSSSRAYVVSDQAQNMIHQNFNALKEFEMQRGVFLEQELHGISVSSVLLKHVDDIVDRGRALEEEFITALNTEVGSRPLNIHEGDGDYRHQLLQCYNGSLGELLGYLRNAFKQEFWSSTGLSEELIGKLTSWKVTFDSYKTNLQLNFVHDKLLQTISYATELVNCSGEDLPQIGLHLKHIYVLVGLLLTLGDHLMCEFLAVNKSVSMLTAALANAFAVLYYHDYGGGSEDEGKVGNDECQEATGTGIGEGTGVNDVSDEINDEDQILGTSNKSGNNEDDAQVPSQDCEGIEMEHDFSATAFDLSEDSEDDNIDGDDENEELDSTMGNTDGNGEISKEKLWDTNEDERYNNCKEKYESGPSVNDKALEDEEIRAKDDTSMKADDSEDIDFEDHAEKNGTQDDLEGADDADVKMDKEDAYMEPTGLKPDEVTPCSEDEGDMVEEEDPDEEKLSECPENENEEKTVSGDGTVEEMEPQEVSMDGPSENDKEQKDHESSVPDSLNSEKDVKESKYPQYDVESRSNIECGIHDKGNLQHNESRNLVPDANCFSGGRDNANHDLAPIMDLPPNGTFDMEIMVEDSSKGRNPCENAPASQLLEQDGTSAPGKLQPNPYRSLGNALEGWKERAKVSLDFQEQSSDVPEYALNENASEYGYVLNPQYGTAQALGPATTDQIDISISARERDDDLLALRKEKVAVDMEIDSSEIHGTGHASNMARVTDDDDNPDTETRKYEKWSTFICRDNDDDKEILRESLITLRRYSVREDMPQFDGLYSAHDRDFDYSLDEMKINSTALWRKYEILTTRQSIELAEQLRLIMEPTLASKLQGDFKTGKRINMKKVIPYIASHYRKDKIWLRRTRPNKRDYQVMIAVDDSRSMSESRCGDVAVESLVTVCRAMSLVEVGKLAVTSFGKEGNVRVLHDFDHPFTAEVGAKMVASLSFEQENTIIDEPVFDLLNFLNGFLDHAAGKARLPSGINPLEQLVLIISDGNFHEKEKLKFCVRDFLSKNRLVVFLILDSTEDSIVDRPEVLFEGGKMRISKYLDSFPFPYYVVLRKIEELPKTLADLLRQWFELVQLGRD